MHKSGHVFIQWYLDPSPACTYNPPDPKQWVTMQKSLWIQNPKAVFDPANEGDGVAGGLVISGNRIVERVTGGCTPEQTYDAIFDASQCVLMPGLINTHHHFYQTLTRAHASGLDRPLFEWLQGLYPVWQHLTPALIKISTELAAAELLLSGCTTAVDHHYVFSDSLQEAIDVQAEACLNMGIRAVLTRGSMSLGEDQGGLPPQDIVQTDDLILKDSERLVNRWHNAAGDAMVQIALAPCSPFSVTPGLLKETAALANQLEVGLHTHLAETADENAFCIENFGVRPLEHMANNDWLTTKTWFAHGIHFTKEEIRSLGTAGVGIAHCPSSNMMLGSGICRVPELQQAGVSVGLAVDGSASNDHSNLVQEVRECALLQRLRDGLLGEEQFAQSPLFAPEDALRVATLGGAKLLDRADLGSLAVGAVADLALFALSEPRFSGVQTPVAGLILSGAHRAEHVMVNGVWRVLDAHLVNTDLDKLLCDHQAAAESLWARAT